LINAGKQTISELPHSAYFDSAASFAMIRGGHIDLCVLGAFEVAANGDIANWATSENDTAPAVGGAMDLGAGAKRLWVIMEHTTKDGRPKLVDQCAYPLTTPRAVKRVYTNLGVFEIVPGKGFVVVDLAPGVTLEQAQAASGAPLHTQ
ncbi:MAG TPA: CoA-transferase, partial [Roseomonas sp.]|nr:CoA-transferase [Roseomonas sp.]